MILNFLVYTVMFNSAFKKHKIKICFGLPIIIVVSILIFKIYSYPFKPRLSSPDWIESRYNGWEVEHHDLWIATIVDVVGPKTVKIRNQNGEEKIMDLLYINALQSSEKMKNLYINSLSGYVGQQLFVKGDSDKARFNGVLIDGNGENINLNLTYVPGAVLDMSSTAYIHDREKQLVPYFANINSENRTF